MKKSNSFKAELRRKAEARLSKKKDKTQPLTKADTLRLLHELQVHQIELEMQNEELIRAWTKAEEAYRQYTNLYDLAPVGYFTLGRDGTIRQVNLAGANLLGVERDKLIKRRLGLFISVAYRPIFNNFHEKLLLGQGRETCELEFLKNKNEIIWARVEATCFEGGQESRAVVIDITERLQAEEALRRLSTHDELTGLYNRGFFMAEMGRLERGRQFPVSIVMADLDDLKHTNDQEGHAAGDVRLRGVAQVLTTAFRTEDVVARIGGDEFAVLLPNTDAATAKVLLGRVHQVIQDNNSAHPETSIQLSLGVSTAEDPTPLSVVLKKADVNMYREKRERSLQKNKRDRS
jgi:diguanylate cyclase (GGDEF)-like protein/PAS domain S-box-containing protein